MKIIGYIFLLLIIVLGFTFACLNASSVNINYYIGSTNMPLSMLLVIAFIVGMIIGMLFMLGWVVKLKHAAYKLRQQHKHLEHELEQQKLSLSAQVPEL
jgi:putative membrane protein